MDIWPGKQKLTFVGDDVGLGVVGPTGLFVGLCVGLFVGLRLLISMLRVRVFVHAYACASAWACLPIQRWYSLSLPNIGQQSILSSSLLGRNPFKIKTDSLYFHLI